MSDVVFLDPVGEEAPYVAYLLPGRSLRGAIDAPRWLQMADGVSDLPTLAARLLWNVNRGHALRDGNKRASIRLADRFLAVNGHRLKGHEDALYDLAYDAAAADVSEDQTRERLRALVAAGAPDAPFEERYPDVIERLAQ